MLRQQARKPSDPGDSASTSQPAAHSVQLFTQHALFAALMCAWCLAITLWIIQAPLDASHSAQPSTRGVQLQCNPASRVVAACAHRGSASELMQDGAPLLDQVGAACHAPRLALTLPACITCMRSRMQDDLAIGMTMSRMHGNANIMHLNTVAVLVTFQARYLPCGRL